MNEENPVYDFLDPPQRDGELGRIGPYRVLELLGQGGMGAVFHARDGRLKRQVALKMMQKKWAATVIGRKRFVEEARSMAAVHHDNVATIFEVGVHRGIPFMAMEMLQGQPLNKLIKGARQFTNQEVLRLALEVARGLGAAHACGIIHRDIKPANIWIEEPTGRAKILDFGLAIAGSNFDRFSARGSVLGSPAFLSPEQSSGEPLDDRTDLYSLGVVLYQMCAGRLPLMAKTIPEQLLLNICHQPVPLKQRKPDIPDPLCDLIEQLLKKEPRDRPRSALDLEEKVREVTRQCKADSEAALRIVTDARPTASIDPPGNQKTKSNSRSKLIKLGAVAGVGLLLIAAGVRSILPGEASPEKTDPITTKENSLADGKEGSQPHRVTAVSLEPLELQPVNAGTRTLTSGQAARFRMRIANNAVGQSNDPRIINASAVVVAQIVTMLQEPGEKQLIRPTFAKKFRPLQLPRPGESKEFEIQFLTKDLSPANFEVTFELQSPTGDPISQIKESLSVAENLSEGELLGFESLRTHAGLGADTYVASGNDNPMGEKPIVQTRRKAGQGKPIQEHVYLRFDLSKSKVAKDTFDRAVLLLSVHPGGFQGTSKIDLYGIQTKLDSQWSESGQEPLVWSRSPCRDGIGGQLYLGQCTIDNFKDNLKDKPDGVRFFSQALDDFVRSAEGDLITIVLIRDQVNDAATRFKSKEGSPDQAPALALRPKNPSK